MKVDENKRIADVKFTWTTLIACYCNKNMSEAVGRSGAVKMTAAKGDT